MSSLQVNNYPNNIYMPKYQNFGKSNTAVNVPQKRIVKDTNNTTNATILTTLAVIGLGALTYVLTRGKKPPTKNIVNTTQRTVRELPAPKTDIPQFRSIKGHDIAKNHCGMGEEVFFLSNGTLARPNIKAQSGLFSEFREVPVLSDEVAKQRFAKIKEEYGLNPHSNSIIDEIYTKIRSANYTEAQTITSRGKTFEQIVATPVNGISSEARQYGDWYYRWPTSKHIQGHAKCRITLDAKIDEDLIKKLDQYLLDNNLTVQYKMPSGMKSACHRPDTYNIYFYDGVTPKIKQDIANMAKPYVREGADKCYKVGEELCNGVYLQPEAGIEDTRDIIKILSAINPKLSSKVSAACGDLKWNSRLSAGQAEAAKIFIRKLLEP